MKQRMKQVVASPKWRGLFIGSGIVLLIAQAIFGLLLLGASNWYIWKSTADAKDAEWKVVMERETKQSYDAGYLEGQRKGVEETQAAIGKAVPSCLLALARLDIANYDTEDWERVSAPVASKYGQAVGVWDVFPYKGCLVADLRVLSPSGRPAYRIVLMGKNEQDNWEIQDDQCYLYCDGNGSQ